ncbi:MAG: tRNA pseudouridine(55) synthase TruB [Chlamydiales bacterium]|nr:tRNA pseudouridine(55) synthase TruB [Chlamydiales bacterium]
MTTNKSPSAGCKGILLINKSAGSTSFQIVRQLRRLLHVEKIGHAGTLDPFATGVMVMLVGREFTRLSNEFLGSDKEYHALVHLGVQTDSYDIDGTITAQSDLIPSLDQIHTALMAFQGQVSQIPPMFSAKKVGGQKLYDLARKGIEIERQPVTVQMKTTLIHYEYPNLELHIHCSKGTYIRSLAHDLGQMLGCGGHLSALTRLKSGPYHLEECLSQEVLQQPGIDLQPHLRSI